MTDQKQLVQNIIKIIQTEMLDQLLETLMEIPCNPSLVATDHLPGYKAGHADFRWQMRDTLYLLKAKING